MFRPFIAALIAAQFAFSPTMAQAQSLEPDGPWRVDYADNECRLTRSFGTGDGAIGLRIARGATLNKYDIIIAGNKLPYGTAAREVKLTATPANITSEVTANPYTMKDSKLRIWRWFDIEETFIDGLNDQQTLSFAGRGMDVRLRTPGLKKAIGALKTCHDDLLTNVFKLDIATLRTLSKHPEAIGKPGTWITTNDYPRSAVNAGQTGTTQLAIQVGADGKPVACNILVSSGTEILDKTACNLVMVRANFSPALNQGGKPVPGIWLRSIRWTM